MMDQRDSLAREIDEELRREQLLKLWEKYGTYVIAAAVLIIAGIGGFKYYEYRRIAAAEAAGARFATAAREAAQDKKAEAQKALEEVAANAPAGYAALARLRLAAADRDAGKTAQALAALRDDRQGAGVDPLLADYARLQAAMLRLGQRRLDGNAELAQRSGSGRQRLAFQRPGVAWAGSAEGRQDRGGAHAVPAAPERSQYAAGHRRAGACHAGHADGGGADERTACSCRPQPAPEPKAPAVDDKAKAKAPAKASK